MREELEGEDQTLFSAVEVRKTRLYRSGDDLQEEHSHGQDQSNAGRLNSKYAQDRVVAHYICKDKKN